MTLSYPNPSYDEVSVLQRDYIVYSFDLIHLRKLIIIRRSCVWDCNKIGNTQMYLFFKSNSSDFRICLPLYLTHTLSI